MYFGIIGLIHVHQFSPVPVILYFCIIKLTCLDVSCASTFIHSLPFWLWAQHSSSLITCFYLGLSFAHQKIACNPWSLSDLNMLKTVMAHSRSCWAVALSPPLSLPGIKKLLVLWFSSTCGCFYKIPLFDFFLLRIFLSTFIVNFNDINICQL